MDGNATIIIAVATLIGPILAVVATRIVDVWRERSQRRYQIFVALMATRRQTLNNAHVEAINKIDVEFANNREVIRSLRAYMDELEEPINQGDNSLDLRERRRRRRFAELIQAIGKATGKRLDKNDFLEGGFYPQGWADYEDLQFRNMKLFNSLLSQRSALKISASHSSQEQTFSPDNSKYPPLRQVSRWKRDFLKAQHGN